MREAMTQALQATLTAAQQAARELNQDFVGTEHLMLGLLAGDGDAVHALKSAHSNLSALKKAISSSLPHGEQPPVVTGNLPLSPKSQRMLNDAIVKTQSAHQPKISTRFLLKALLDEPGTAVHKALAGTGVDVDSLSHQLDQVPTHPEQ